MSVIGLLVLFRCSTTVEPVGQENSLGTPKPSIRRSRRQEQLRKLRSLVPIEVLDQIVGEGIGVRFISQIPLKENERPSKYVQKVPPPLRGLGLRADAFFHQDTIPLKGYPYEVRLIRAMQPAAEKTGSKRVLIVDIDVSTTEAVTFENVDRTLNELRYIKNKVFFTYMKDADKHFQ